jgi:hypothetical protein
MTHDADKEHAITHRVRFGQIAVKMGFISGQQLKEAISEQIDDDLADTNHRFLGDILLGKQLLNLEQVDLILDEIFKQEMRIKGVL